MKDRFDLEQEIMGCWNVVTDLKTVCTAVLEKDLSQDKIANLLMGLEELYQLKFESLFETFEDTIRNGELDGLKNDSQGSLLSELWNETQFPTGHAYAHDDDFEQAKPPSGMWEESLHSDTDGEGVRAAPHTDDEDFENVRDYLPFGTPHDPLTIDDRAFSHEEYQAHKSKTFNKLFPDHEC